MSEFLGENEVHKGSDLWSVFKTTYNFKTTAPILLKYLILLLHKIHRITMEYLLIIFILQCYFFLKKIVSSVIFLRKFHKGFFEHHTLIYHYSRNIVNVNYKYYFCTKLFFSCHFYFAHTLLFLILLPIKWDLIRDNLIVIFLRYRTRPFFHQSTYFLSKPQVW